jgi:hypothetical protein
MDGVIHGSLLRKLPNNGHKNRSNNRFKDPFDDRPKTRSGHDNNGAPASKFPISLRQNSSAPRCFFGAMVFGRSGIRFSDQDMRHSKPFNKRLLASLTPARWWLEFKLR